MMVRLVVAIVVVLVAGLRTAAGIVVTRFEPPSQTVAIGDSFTVDIVADIDLPVVGWGLDASLVTPGIASLTGMPAIGADWIGAFAPDGDGLAGLASPLPPINGSVSGIGVVLATLSFSADSLGGTDLLLSVTPGDLTEGFALDPTGFASVTFQPGFVNVVPEPSAVLLIGVGCTLLIPRQKRR